MQYEFRLDKFWEHAIGARKSRGLSQAQVGAELGVGGSTVSQWESGKRQLPAHRFMALCDVFDLDPMAYYRKLVPAGWQQPRLPWRMNHAHETVYRTPEEIERFERMDLEVDAPVGYHREQADLRDYYRLDREMGY